MSNPKNDKALAFLGTVVVHLLVLLVLVLMAFRTPLPLPGEEGVEVDLGLYNQGMGQEQPDKPAIPEQPAPATPHDETTTQSKE